MNKEMALEGLKILDFTWVAVGPITVKYLADHGATVIRVESLSRPDVLRGGAPFKDGIRGINRSQFPAAYNTSKYGLGLNMDKPESRDVIRRLISTWQPDLIAENFTPRVMRKWELDYRSVNRIKNDIIYFSTCQQGQNGPNASFAGFGMQAAALAGFYSITGWKDEMPMPPYGAYSDFISPANAAAAIIAALEYRRRTGKGQHIDLSQYECAVQFLAPGFLDVQTGGKSVNRNGNYDEDYVPHGIYPCAIPGDEAKREAPTNTWVYWCAIAVTSQEEWFGLCNVMGIPNLSTDKRFNSLEQRQKHREELDNVISGWTIKHEAHPLMNLLQDEGIPAGVVQSQSELWTDPQLKHRQFYQVLNHTECGPMPYDGLQFLLSKTPGKLRLPHALIGEHNDLILKEFVGLSNEDIADLIACEALETS